MANKKLNLAGIALLGSLALVSCDSNPTIIMQKKEEAKLNPDSRYAVERVEVFEDDLAYKNRRGIYLIKDRKTGKEYFGVSGIGITELGEHDIGDSNIPDER